MDEELRRALAAAAAAEKEKAPPPRPARKEPWWAAPVRERRAQIARNWQGTLAWIREGKTSRDAALAAFVETCGDAGTITFEGRSRSFFLLELELATALRANTASPHLVDAYRVYARRLADQKAVGAEAAHRQAEIRRLEAKLDAAVKRRDEQLAEAEARQTELDAVVARKTAALAELEQSQSWFARRLLPEGRKAVAEVERRFKGDEVRLQVAVAEAVSAAEMADGEQILAAEELRSETVRLAGLEQRLASGHRELLDPLGIEPASAAGELPIAMARVEAGRFWMGTADTGDRRYADEVPLRRVELTRPYAISVVPVTQALYLAVTGDDPARYRDPVRPVERVTWYDAARFCNGLSQLCGLEAAYHIGPGEEPRVRWRREANGFRLPTEAEWEKAARADQAFEFAGSDDPGRVAWYARNAGSQTHPVGQKAPNGIGLYDMSGNVIEWCWDGYAADVYRTTEPRDPVGPDGAAERVARGGSAAHGEDAARVAARSSVKPGATDVFLGFRVARFV